MCAYVYMCVYMQVPLSLCEGMCEHVFVCTCAPACVCVCVNVYVYMCGHVCVCAHVYARMQASLEPCPRVCSVCEVCFLLSP